MRIKLGVDVTLEFIKSALGITASREDCFINITHISTDTRCLRKGDIFIALRGEKYDGNDFLKDAAEIGAICIGRNESYAAITVSDTEDSLLKIAQEYLKLIAPRHVIAITGSVGKTTTKDLLYTLLAAKYRVHKTAGNLNSTIGVPFTVLAMPRDTEILVCEAGMNHTGELLRISRCLRQDLTVITRIGTAHIGNLGSRENIAAAKLEILRHASDHTTIIPYGEPLLENAGAPITVSTSSPDADFSLICTDDRADGLYCSFNCPDFRINDLFIAADRPHIPLCMAYAMAAATVIGMTKDDIVKAILRYNEAFVPSNTSINGTLIIDDSYNSSPEAVELALSELARSPIPTAAVLGDMLELGDYTPELHEQVGEIAARAGVCCLFALGDMREHVARGAMRAGLSEEHIYTPDYFADKVSVTRDIADKAKGKAVLIKGSHKLGLGELAQALVKLLKETDDENK